jgi:hypothetical protein
MVGFAVCGGDGFAALRVELHPRFEFTFTFSALEFRQLQVR